MDHRGERVVLTALTPSLPLYPGSGLGVQRKHQPGEQKIGMEADAPLVEPGGTSESKEQP